GRVRPVRLGLVRGHAGARRCRADPARAPQAQRAGARPVKPRHKRIAMIVGGLAALGAAAAFVLAAFNENLVFFFTPTEVEARKVPQGRAFRIGGMVVPGSVKRQGDGVTVEFVVTDTAKNVPVVYKGILPDLFKEGKGVVTEGKLGGDGVF